MSDTVTTTATTRLLEVSADPKVTYTLPATPGETYTVAPHAPTPRDCKQP